jgi:hypothetical protein
MTNIEQGISNCKDKDRMTNIEQGISNFELSIQFDML